MGAIDDIAIVEFANDAFYAAFVDSDLDAMTALWLKGPNTVCTHPGWPPLVGSDAIIASFAEIFGSGATPISHHPVTVLPQHGIYSVLCFEELGGNWLIATNNFVMTDEGARLIHHQASQCPAPDLGEARRPQ